MIKKQHKEEEIPKGFYPIGLNLPSLKAHTGKYYTLEGKEITTSRYSRFINSADEVSPTEIYTLIVENAKLRSRLLRISTIFMEFPSLIEE